MFKTLKQLIKESRHAGADARSPVREERTGTARKVSSSLATVKNTRKHGSKAPKSPKRAVTKYTF